jgi:chromosome segregation ATPase
MPKIKGKPFTIEDWKKETDAARKRAKYWEEKQKKSEWLIKEVRIAHKTDVQTLQNCNAALRGSKDELFKLYEERAALLDGLSSKVSEKSKTIESLVSQNQTSEQVINKLKGDCMILESHNTDLIHSIISTKVFAIVGWIFVLILLVAFILK